METALLLVLACSERLTIPGRSNPESQWAGRCHFSDATEKAGLRFVHTWGSPRMRNMVDSVGSGVGFFDYDGDGQMDIFLAQSGGGESRLYRNEGNWTFTDVTEKAGLKIAGYGMGVAAADYDNDGHQDFFVTSYGRNILFHNSGNGTFTDVTEKAGLEVVNAFSTQAAWADIDNDGHLDLYVTHYIDYRPEMKHVHAGALSKREGFSFFPGPRDYDAVTDTLYRNNGNGTFENITENAGLSPGGKGLGVAFSDLDNDGDQDIFVANDRTPKFLYENDGKGRFREHAFRSGVAVSEDGEATAGMAVAVDDFDGDGLLDLVMTNMIFEFNSLFRNEGGMRFRDIARASHFAEDSYRFVGFGVASLDIDNDGWRDILVNNGHMVDYIDAFSQSMTSKQERQVYLNRGGGQFSDVTRDCGDVYAVRKLGRGLAYADVDDDGKMDLLAADAGERPALYHNATKNSGHWLRIRVSGRKSNRDGIGAKIFVTVGDRTQIQEVRAQSSYLATNDPRNLFGLGENDGADAIELRWPSGRIDRIGPTKADQTILIEEGVELKETAP